MGTRKYEQRLRAEAAEETRRRILDAVYERLRVAPAQPVSIEQVARTARVARSTVYLIFGSRTRSPSSWICASERQSRFWLPI